MDNVKQQFLLDKDIVFLNHGSFGSCPKPVFDDYQNWQNLKNIKIQIIQEKNRIIILWSLYFQKAKHAYLTTTD